MQNFFQRLRNFARREDGPTAVEYALMLVLIIVVCLAAITTFYPTSPAPIPATPTKFITAEEKTVNLEMPDGGKKTYVVGEAKDGQLVMKEFLKKNDRVIITLPDDSKVVYVLEKK